MQELFARPTSDPMVGVFEISARQAAVLSEGAATDLASIEGEPFLYNERD